MKYEAIRLKFRKLYIKNTYKMRKKKLKNREFTIISNNCWGGFVYQSYGLEYSSPTVGLFFEANDYIKFVKNLKKYISMDLKFINPKETKLYGIKNINYPVGRLGDIDIYFMHYKTEKDAKEKWERRCKRINWNKILYKFSNQNLCTIENIKEFMNLNLKNKICFVNKKELAVSETIYVRQLMKTEDILASYEPYGKNKYFNLNKILNQML